MRKTVKAIISVILSAILLFSVAAPGYAQVDNKKIPIILVAGQGIPLYNSEGEEIYPFDFELNAEFLGEAFKKLNPGFMKGYLTGDYGDYCDAACELIGPIFETIRLDNNGNCPNGIQAKPHGHCYYGEHNDMVYRFHYDWRLDPLEIVDRLDAYINSVRSGTGSDKVNIICRCLGVNVIASYLDVYGDAGEAKINKIMMYCSAFWGTELSSELFSGDFNVDPTGVENFLLNDLKNDLVMDLIKGSVSLLNSMGGLNLAADFVNNVYEQIKDDFIPRLIMLTYGTFPSYWSMVSPWNYDKAKAFVFRDGRETEYAGLIEKIDNYHERIQLRGEEILKKAQSDGVIIGNICKYGKSLAPVVADVYLNADEMVSVYASSMGATTKDYNEPLDDEYIEAARINGTYKYISPDKQIDASTCLFPDTTWFIKNVGHRTFPECIETDLMLPFFRRDGEMTVYSDRNLSQFLVYDEIKDTIVPMTKDNNDTEVSSGDNIRMLIKKLFETVFNWFKKWIGDLLAKQ
ncbi:MAG: hypothetical protein K5756_09230 [Clostridiales bacterium]|nr:hypothetical protein [Clostridiales bacterium]